MSTNDICFIIKTGVKMDCLFCKIIKKEIPSAVIFEDNDTMAFLDIAPVNKGHVLIVPKVHSDDFISTEDEVIDKVFRTAKKISNAIVKATGAHGVNISVNNGAAAGQVIFHLHAHIIPRFEEDGLKPWPKVSYSENEMKEFAEMIKKAINEN